MTSTSVRDIISRNIHVSSQTPTNSTSQWNPATLCVIYK